MRQGGPFNHVFTLSLLKLGKLKGVRFSTLIAIPRYVGGDEIQRSSIAFEFRSSEAAIRRQLSSG